MKRICKVCKETKELCEGNFYRRSSNKLGFETKCKECRRKDDKMKYEYRKSKILEQKKVYYRRKKERARKQQAGQGTT